MALDPLLNRSTKFQFNGKEYTPVIAVYLSTMYIRDNVRVSKKLGGGGSVTGLGLL